MPSKHISQFPALGVNKIRSDGSDKTLLSIQIDLSRVQTPKFLKPKCNLRKNNVFKKHRV